MAEQDGGPAFPATNQMVNERGGGMSLRDYFAAKAMATYLRDDLAALDMAQVDEDLIADCAYSMADAMLRARTAQSPADVQRAHLDTFGGKR